MMKKTALLFTTVLLAVVYFGSALWARSSPKPHGHSEWVEKSLKEMGRIKVGSTRAELLKVFTEEGGLSSPVRETFAYRECSLIKVDVYFAPAGRPARDAEGRAAEADDTDVITQISRPYLDWPVAD